MDDDSFTLTAAATYFVDPFASLTEDHGAHQAPAEETEATEPDLLADSFVLTPLVEIGFGEEMPAQLPAWLTAFLAGDRITITPENVELFQEFADAQADQGSLYYTHPAVVGAGLMAGDLFDFVQT